MTLLQHLPIFTIKLGAPDTPASSMTYVPALLMNDIAEIIVDTSLHLPDMVTIRIHDPLLRWTDDPQLFALGKKVLIQVQPERATSGEPQTLIEAEITALEPIFLAEGSTMLVVRGYNKANRLHFGRHSRTFTNQTDSDIVGAIAREAGLTTAIDSTNVKHEYVLQNNQTNMAFLLERAQRIGYQLFVIDEKLYFKRGDTVGVSPTPKLELGKGLQTFRPRMTLAHQANQARVYGWDAKGKRPIRGRAQASHGLNEAAVNPNGGGQVVKAAFKLDARAIVVDHPVASVAEANALAQGLANDISNEVLEAEGDCRGNPLVRAGCKVEVAGVGQRFSGNYFVTAATHVYSTAGYWVNFTVHGRQPLTVNYLLEQGRGRPDSESSRIQGVVVGLVTNLNDPEGLGRVKVKFPWLVDDDEAEIESPWAKIATPSAGQDKKGFYYLPEIDDEVLLSFEHGDVNRPYLVGMLWNNKDRPPKANNEVVKGGKVVQRILRSRKGHEIVMDDSDDKPFVAIHTQGGHTIDLDDTTSAPMIAVQSSSGHKIVLDDSPGKSAITIKDASGANQIIMDAVKNEILIQAGVRLHLKAAQIVLEAQTNVEIRGIAGSSIQADGPINIRSSSMVSVQGGVIRLN